MRILLTSLLLSSFLTFAQKTVKDSVFSVGDIVEFPEIGFSYDKPQVLPQYFDSVKVIADFLERNPSIQLEIGNHTDPRGSAAYNLELSKRRAEMVFIMLIDRFSVKPDRITFKGYGETQPIVPNETIEKAEPAVQENYRRLCRRTEGKILKI